ncbi:hypothetical protein GEMRC1_009993 [Eukaryota sp. GEM-RC1]
MKSLELFCTFCSVALCSTCAFLGDHDQHKKKLLPFNEGRTSIEKNINSINQELSLAIEKYHSQLKLPSSKQQMVLSNSKKV